MYSFFYKLLVCSLMALCIKVVMETSVFIVSLVAVVCFLELLQRLVITIYFETYEVDS